MPRQNGEQPFMLTQFNPWIATANPLIDTSLKLTGAVCTRAFEVAAELTDFTLLRVQEDVRLPERLSHCRSPQDVQQAWGDFWSKALEQYQKEWTKLAEINRGGMAELSQEIEKVQRQTRIAA